MISARSSFFRFFIRAQLRPGGLGIATGTQGSADGGAPGVALDNWRARLLAVTVVIAAVSMGHCDAWAQAAGAEWTRPASTAEGTRFSSFKQIEQTPRERRGKRHPERKPTAMSAFPNLNDQDIKNVAACFR